MADAPTGTVTFLFTDIEGSTRLWEERPGAMRDALERHDAVVGRAIADAGGHVVKTTGDGALASFWTATEAAAAAAAAQRALSSMAWAEVGELRVRMAIHTGTAEFDGSDYHGPALNRAARLMGLAGGGQVLVSHPTEELLRDALPAGLSLLDLGNHQLRDMRSEHVFQLVGADLPSDFPPLSGRAPGNLPLEVTSFVGRDDELAAIAKLLGNARLVTIVGAGGVGKTRLALRVASLVAERFPDGAWLCELAAAADADDLEQIVATAVGARPRPGSTLAGSIAEHLRPRRVLLVLDNCEHLLGAAADLAEQVLRGCGDVRILATSREVLSLHGEQVFGLRTLSVESATELFLDRARAARPDLAVDATNAAAVREICERLDGMALAIELAAARAASMTPFDIAAHLDERFRLLTGGRRNAVERHQTLRATVEWSYSLLEERERTVFDRLGVFPSTFDSAAAGAVAAGSEWEAWDVLDALDALVSKSMLTVDDTAGDTTRYQLLETLRRYALEQLAARGEVDATRRRHAAHFAAFAAVARPVLQSAAELPMRQRLTLELDNLRAAINWAVDSEDTDDGEFAVSIIAELGYEVSQARATGFGTWVERAIPAAERSTPGRRAAVLAAAAMSASQRADYDRSRALSAQACQGEVPRDCPSPLNVLVIASITATSDGDISGGLALLRDGYRLLDEADDFGHSNLHAVAAILCTVVGDIERARPDAVESVRLARRCGSPSQLAIALFSYGYAFGTTDPVAAIAALDESIALTEHGATDAVIVQALGQRARHEAAAGDTQAALRSLVAAFRHSQLVADHGDLGNALDYAIELLSELGQMELVGVIIGFVNVRIAGYLDAGVREAREAALATVHERLGRHGDALVTQGAEMSRDQLCAYLVEELGRLC